MDKHIHTHTQLRATGFKWLGWLVQVGKETLQRERLAGQAGRPPGLDPYFLS